MLTANSTLQHGRYRIIRPVAQGGMGAVYEAYDNNLNNRIALKEALLTEPELRRAFEREAQRLDRLRHVALPTVKDHFMEDGKQYLVMEYIEGDDLRKMLQQRGQPFPVAQVLAWADGLLDALIYLHRRNPPLVHRDIKPANLKLTDDGQIILLDFGLAKGGLTQRTLAGQSLYGYTPGYAPPEQMEGERTDERSDLYALGATLYALLSGETPDDPLTRRKYIKRGYPDPLLPINQVNPQVPPHIARVLQLATAIESAQRPNSATQMRAMLKPPPFRSQSQPVATQSPPVSSVSTGSNNRFALLFGLMVAFVLLMGTAYIYSRNSNDNNEPVIAVAGDSSPVINVAAVQPIATEPPLTQVLSSTAIPTFTPPPPTQVPPTQPPPSSAVPPTAVPPTAVPPTAVPPTQPPLPTAVGPTQPPPPTAVGPTQPPLPTAVGPTQPPLPTAVPPLPTAVGPTQPPPPPTAVQPAAVQPTQVPPAAVQPTQVPLTAVPPTQVPAAGATTRAQASSLSGANLPVAGPTTIAQTDGMVEVYVPEGDFEMGSADDDPDAEDDEKPRHTIYLDAFWIDQTEVTNAMFADFLNEEGNQVEDDVTWLEEGNLALIEQVNGTFQPKSGFSDHPVIEVSWYGATAYCAWAERRLPTEAEWEKAAGGTDGRTFPWGNEARTDLVNYLGTNDGYERTSPVGNYSAGASPYGAFDMAGNVWEWVSDSSDSNYYTSSPRENPAGPSPKRTKIFRGGSWLYTAPKFRVRNRGGGDADYSGKDLGFRCARSQ